MTTEPTHYCEGQARLELGPGFFRPESRPSRDFGVLLLRWIQAQSPDRVGVGVLDGMAGCGIRALRYGLEGGATEVLANDADPERLPLLQANLAALGLQPPAVECSALTIEKLLAACLLQERRFDLVDLDAFGAPTAFLPLALEAVRFGGILYLASTDGRSFTGHDRTAALRRLGAAVRAQPCSWELALRLQLGLIARAAWGLGRGIRPLLSFSEGRTFRCAVQVLRHPAVGEEQLLGMQAYCHHCGNHRGMALLKIRDLVRCSCGQEAVLSGPLWRGPLQDVEVLQQLQALEAGTARTIATSPSLRLLQRLSADDGLPPEASDVADLARQLGGGPPPLESLLQGLRQRGWCAQASGIAPGQFRTNAPWDEVVREGAKAR